MNGSLEAVVRNSGCTKCKLHERAEIVCQTGHGPDNARIMAVSKFPGEQKRLVEYLEQAGVDTSTILWTSAVKCVNWSVEPGVKDIKACRDYLLEEIDHVKPQFVITFGNEALQAVTKRSGISKYRGKHFEIQSPSGLPVEVFPTISPGVVNRNPGMAAGLFAELRFFKRLLDGERVPFEAPANRVHRVEDKDALRRLVAALESCDVAAYDIETNGFHETAQGALIVSLSITTATKADMSDAEIWQVPLYHSESVWRNSWKRVLRIILPYLEKVRALVAHNGKFDSKWMHKFTGIKIGVTFDTIMAISLVNENSVKALKPLCQQILGVPPWGIDTTDLLNTPLDEVLEYNGLDTWYDLALYFKLKQEISKNPKQRRIFQRLSVPVINELIDIEGYKGGIWINVPKLQQNMNKASTQAALYAKKLSELVPPRDQWPDKLANKEVNWNVSDFLRWFVFDHLDLPVLAWGKDKEDGSRNPSVGRQTLQLLAKDYGSVECELLLEYRRWTKMVDTFFEPYLELMDESHRLHTTYKPWVPVTGRLSSGKEDQEKAVTKASQHNGVNLQQVPKDVLVRGVFGAPPGFVWVEADYSQLEMRIAAFLSRDPVLLHAYNTGQDVHMLTAIRMTGKPASRVTKKERDGAKPVNFGFLFGMGWSTFIDQAFRDYGMLFTEEEARNARKVFFDLYKGLLPWHAQQRRLVNKYGRVQNPIGRVRHLPDINSPDKEVRLGAERQAINSPVQGFGSDLTMLAVVGIGNAFKSKGMASRVVGTVHDSIMIEAPEAEGERAAKIIKYVMEHPPLEKYFGINMDVPLLADVEIGKYWGEKA